MSGKASNASINERQSVKNIKQKNYYHYTKNKANITASSSDKEILCMSSKGNYFSVSHLFNTFLTLSGCKISL